MKIIHCADLHLDSKLHTHLDRVRAKQRRDELLHGFARLADYAAENAVEVVLIAGDLFDRDTVSALARSTVLEVIRSHPGIRFYYLRGNHDTGDCLRSRQTETIHGAPKAPASRASEAKTCLREENRERGMPENLFLFANRWRTYPEGSAGKSGQGRLAITGIELPGDNAAVPYASLRLDPDRFNIVLLHGQVTDLSSLRGKNIDYLALGHLHMWREAPLDDRGIWCYPGCLEGRGFDECGPHGFVLLEIDEQRRTMTRSFVPFAKRQLYALETDVAGCLTTAQMYDLVENALRDAGCRPADLVDVTLRGELDVECEKDIGYLRSALETRFFFVRLHDATTLRIDLREYLYDESLRGEFVRTVLEDPTVPEEEKAEVIRFGFQAMDGEELL